MESAGFEVRCQIIWGQNTFAWGFGRYKFQHEPIFYSHVAGQKDPGMAIDSMAREKARGLEAETVSKRIAFCADGTWDTSTKHTNVYTV